MGTRIIAVNDKWKLFSNELNTIEHVETNRHLPCCDMLDVDLHGFLVEGPGLSSLWKYWYAMSEFFFRPGEGRRTEKQKNRRTESRDSVVYR